MQGPGQEPLLPLPMVNMISGGKHAGANLDFQDYLILPVGAESYPQAFDWIVTVYENGERKGQGAFTFSEDGRYTMSKLVEHQRGRYAHLNDNRLIMRAEGYEVEQMQVEWDGRHRFVTTSGKQKFVFDRYGTLQMETNS